MPISNDRLFELVLNLAYVVSGEEKDKGGDENPKKTFAVVYLFQAKADDAAKVINAKSATNINLKEWRGFSFNVHLLSLSN